jgi:hypothetical protein
MSRPDNPGPRGHEQMHPIEDQPETSNVITNTDEFASLVARWHLQGMKQAEHMLEMPEGHEAEYQANENEEPVRIVLTGDALIAFRMGVMTGADCFANLPFTYSLDEAVQEADNATPDN